MLTSTFGIYVSSVSTGVWGGPAGDGSTLGFLRRGPSLIVSFGSLEVSATAEAQTCHYNPTESNKYWWWQAAWESQILKLTQQAVNEKEGFAKIERRYFFLLLN